MKMQYRIKIDNHKFPINHVLGEKYVSNFYCYSCCKSYSSTKVCLYCSSNLYTVEIENITK
jgi:hypothetical protein